ncbi:hypothetical protein B0H10DRAFT_2238505 [Mycena sp. CBHHK59/15]|nr:hypothetical protein B0H10DRAFT_2238505 [Mycena sp. CBHHK59/15]
MSHTSNSAFSPLNQATISLEDFRQDVVSRISRRQRGIPETEAESQTTGEALIMSLDDFKTALAAKLPAKKYVDLHNAPGSTPPLQEVSVHDVPAGNLHSHPKFEPIVKKEPVSERLAGDLHVNPEFAPIVKKEPVSGPATKRNCDRKKKSQNHCGRCGQLGHNSRTCRKDSSTHSSPGPGDDDDSSVRSDDMVDQSPQSATVEFYQQEEDEEQEEEYYT